MWRIQDLVSSRIMWRARPYSLWGHWLENSAEKATRLDYHACPWRPLAGVRISTRVRLNSSTFLDIRRRYTYFTIGCIDYNHWYGLSPGIEQNKTLRLMFLFDTLFDEIFSIFTWFYWNLFVFSVFNRFYLNLFMFSVFHEETACYGLVDLVIQYC